MKKYPVFFVVCLSLLLIFILCACNGGDINDNDLVGDDLVGDDLKIEILPTANDVVLARANVIENRHQDYDFKINLAGNINVSGFSGTANANYEGNYRYDSSTKELKFKRITSGALLYDSTEYIYTSGSSKIKLVANKDGTIKKTSIVTQEEEGLNLINIPFVAIVDTLEVSNISTITKTTSGAYKYATRIALSASNANMQALLNIIGNFGATLEMSDVTFTNIANGIDFYFNLNEDKKLDDFMYSVQISFPIKGVNASLHLTYSQKANSKAIAIPSIEGLITDSEEIASEISDINSAITLLKNSDTYSLDLTAKNEFDPAWNILATVDRYIARLYKNTNGNRVDFNHSFEYKAHTEKQGAETYKYTIANIQDGTVHQVSRKGINVVTELDDINVDNQFDYLMSTVMLNPADINCIKKITQNDIKILKLYMSKAETYTVQEKIAKLINSNEAEGVLDVDNYFNNAKNMIKESEISIEMKAGEIVKIEITTEIRYNPTGGEYTERQITLTNSIILKVNDNVKKAQSYEAPKTTSTPLAGLNNAKYYIG